MMKIHFGKKPIQEFDKNPTEPHVVRVDTIICPVCHTIQQAEVVWDERSMWPTFIHSCTKCNYVITDREWTEVAK